MQSVTRETSMVRSGHLISWPRLCWQCATVVVVKLYDDR